MEDILATILIAFLIAFFFTWIVLMMSFFRDYKFSLMSKEKFISKCKNYIDKEEFKKLRKLIHARCRSPLFDMFYYDELIAELKAYAKETGIIE